MADKQINDMHPDFHTWYRSADLGNAPEVEKLRWTGLAGAVGKLTRDDIEALVRLVFRTKAAPAPESIARFRQAFKSADPDGYDTVGNAKELEILAASTLAVAIKKGNSMAAVAALAVTTTSCNHLRATSLPMNLVELSEAALIELSENMRKRPDLTSLSRPTAQTVDFSKAIDAVAKQFDPTGVSAAITAMADVTKAALTRADEKVAKTVSYISNVLATQDEELQMLWWLTGGRSWDMDKPFASLGSAQCIVLAKELAQMTQRLPGPISVKALLSRAGFKEANEQTIPEAINACSLDWLKQFSTSTEYSSATQLLHFGIARRLEMGDETKWIEPWAAAAGVEAERKFKPLDIANIFYRERILTVL